MRDVAAAITALTVAAVAAGCASGAVEFDSARWKAARATACSDDGDRVRERMLGDLRENRLRLGMARRQVLALLGRPDAVRGARLQWATQGGLTRCHYLLVTFADDRVVMIDHAD